MPIYSVRGPDGAIYDIEGPEGASDRQVIAALQRHLQANAPQRGLGAAFKRGLESQLSAGRTGVGVYAGTPEEAAQAAREGLTRQEEIGRKYEDQIGLDRLKKAYEEKGVLAAGKELARQVPLALAEQAPFLATTLGGARLGAMAGAPLGPVGSIVGGVTGAAVPSLLEQAGSQAERRAQEQIKRGEPISIDRGELAKTAIPGAALDVAGTFIPLGGRLVSKVTGIPLGAFAGRSAAQAERLANERLLATLAKGTAKGAAVEIPTEIAQQMLERAQAGLPLTGPEAFAEYGELAYRVGLLGPIGAVGRLSEKGAAQQDIADRRAAEAAKARGAAAPEAAPEPEAAPAAPEIPIEERKFQDITPVPGAVPERRFRDITPVPEQLAPTEEPVTQQPSNVVDMMDAYEVANSQLEPLETALQNAAKAGDTDAINALSPQYKELRAQLDKMKSSIEELGGTTKSAETFEQDAADSLAKLDKNIAAAQKKLNNAAELGEFDALPKLGENLKTLKAEREAQVAQFDKERRVLTMKNTPKGETVDMLGSAAPKSEEVLSIPYDTLEQSGEGQPVRRSSGSSKILNYAGRMIVMRNVNGIQVPFYLSTGGGGKVDVPAGKWFPFFGIGADGWINKTTGKEMVNYYGSPALKQVAEELDATIGDIRNDSSIPRVPGKGRHIDFINRGLAPAESERPDTLDKVNQNITKIKSLVDAEKGLTKDVGAGPLPPEDFRRRGKKQLELELEPPKPLARLTAPWRSAKEQREAQAATPEGETYPLFRDIPQRKQPEVAAPVEAAPKAEPTGITFDLFSHFNILNTAINNRDEKTIEAMQRARKAADDKARKIELNPREQVAAMFDQNVGRIVRREKNYDVRVITKGPNEGQEIYVHDTIMAELERLTKLVNEPVGNAKRSRLQILHDQWDILQEREAKLEEAKASGDAKAIKKFEGQVAVALRNYERTLKNKKTGVLPIRDQYEKVWRSLFTQTGKLDYAPGEEVPVSVMTPRQKQEALLREGRSKREMSKEAKAAKRVGKGKVKVSGAKVAQELGRATDEYKAFIAPYEKKLAAAVKAYEKFVDNANKELTKRKLKEVDKKEVAKVEKQLAAAIAARDAVPFENPIERKKADKLVNSLEQHLQVVVTPKSKEYKAAEANIVKLQKQKIEELNRLKAEFTEVADAKAEELGIQQPEFEEALAEATEAYQEAVAGGEQQIKSLRTTQATRKLPRMKTTRTASTESRAETARRQAEFEGGLTAEKGEAYDYQQREDARERTQRARQAKEAKGTAMQVAMTKAAQEKVMSEVSAKEKERYALGSETESKDLTKDQVKLLEENKLQDAYKSISEDDTNQPLNRAVALALEVYADKTDVVIHDTLYSPDGKEALGLATSRKIDLSRDGGLSQEVLLHEGTHSAVERTIQMAQDDITLLSKEQQAAYRELEALYNSVKKDPAITSANAKSNISEFAAEVMSNENLQKQLKQKKWRVSNAFRGFVSIILRMIGVQNVDNMLDASVAAVEALMVQTSIGQKATEQAKAKPKEDIGVFEKAKGAFGFRSETQPTQFASSFVAQEKGAVDNFRANALGLAGRVQFVDQYAALTEALRKGVDSEVVKDLEAEQAEYFLRFGQQRSQFATQFLTNGAVKLVSQDTKRGKEFTYESKPGANMIQVAEALEKAGIGNSTQLEAMFTAYVAGKRAKQVGWDKLNISNPALAKSEYDEVIAALNADPKAKAAFEEAAKIYKEYNAGLLDFLVQTGYMSKAKADELKGIDYVPYYRVKGGELQLLVDKETPVRIANIKDQPELHSLVGDNAQIMPIFTSAVQNTFILTNMGLRNQSIKDTSFLLKRMGIASKLGEGVGPSSPDTVRFKVKGEDYFAVIDSDAYGIPAELIVKGMEGIKTTIPAAVRLMGIPADWLRTFVTRNPAYALRQAVRDPLTAYMTTGVDGVPVLNSFKELSKMIAGRSEEERKLMASGAISTNVLTGDEKDMEKALRDISAGKSGYTKLLAKADALAMQGDAATRAVIYKDSIAKGMSDMQAYLRTLESMNFSRRGLSPSMQMLSTLIPFFNAQIQGLDVAYRAFTGKYGGMPYQKQLEIKKKLLMRGTLMAMATMAYVMTMEDDEAYKRAKPEERLGNWFVYTPFADEPLRVPIPFEFGYLFKALPEAVYNLAADDERNKDITKGMGKLIGMSNPFALPAAIKPATEVILGRSFFGGDIESMREQQTMLPTERYRANTTELSKLIGSMTGDAGITPIKLDYFLRGHFGGFGMALISLANPILNTEVGADVAEPTLKASKTPFIGGLFQPVEGRGTLDAAYERMLEVQQASGTFKRLLESGKRAEAMEFLEEYRNKVAAISVSGAVQQRLGELSKYRRMIIETPKLTTEQKDVLLDRIDAQQYEIARGFVNLTERTKPQ